MRLVKYVGNSTRLSFFLFKPIVKLLIKLKKSSNYDIISCAHAFFAEIANMGHILWRKMPYIANVFLGKEFLTIFAPVYHTHNEFGISPILRHFKVFSKNSQQVFSLKFLKITEYL